jgi:hypothetical protein
MPSVASRSGMRRRMIRKALIRPISAPTARQISTARYHGTRQITIRAVERMTASPVTAPTDTSNPRTTTEKVIPSATIVRIETARKMSRMLSSEANVSVRSEKNNETKIKVKISP